LNRINKLINPITASNHGGRHHEEIYTKPDII
jgi:hypothetical protein